MKRIGLMIGFFAVLVFLLPLSGQDAKKEVDKKDATKTDDKKDPDKKDPDKKDDKKDPDKKDDKKKAIEKIVYGTKFVTKIVGLKGETNREYTVQVQEIDPAKVANMQKWSATRQQQLAQQFAGIQGNDPKDVQGRINRAAQYQKDLYNYKVELAKQQSQVYSAKNLDVRAHETAKVRTMMPPVEFDDQTGFQKKWTKKELDALRDKSPLNLSTGASTLLAAPGYPSDLDAVKQGQNVEIYMAKVTPAKKDDTKKKKTDDDPPPAAKDQAGEFVLIVILQDGK